MLQQLVAESCFLTSSRVSFVSAAVALGVADLDGVALCVALRDGVGVALTDAFGVALTDANGVELAEGLGVEVVLISGPFFQISLVPDLTQRYLTLYTVLEVPALVHFVPTMVAACEGIESAVKNNAVRRTLEYALKFMT
jgi:hypothetical protein